MSAIPDDTKKSGAAYAAPDFRLSIKYISSIYAARASQSSAVPQTAEEGQIVFSGGVYVGKHTSQAASVRTGNPNKAQRSGFVWERRGKGAE